MKVAPTKATSVPRLELVTAVLGLRLARTKLLEIHFENYTLYTFYDVPNKLPPFGLSDHDTVAVQPLARQNLPKNKILLKSRDLQATNRMAMRTYISRGSQPWSPGRSQRVMRRENVHARNNNQDRHGYLALP